LFSGDSNSEIIFEMSTTNYQKTTSLNYEQKSTVFNKTVAGLETQKSHFGSADLQLQKFITK
jgi:hypothetical protein